jgi:tRNA 5-methylaminomethyl-2-thiouridine biosynthesis bifunctional protein
MKRDNTPWRAAPSPTLEWTGSERGAPGVPRSGRFGDVYYARDNGLAESHYVFLAGNGLPDRMTGWPGERFCVGETGFGTGLNFLLTWRAWRSLPAPRPRLHYLSVEKYPLDPRDMERALLGWPELAELSEHLLASYPPRVPGAHRLLLDDGQVVLDLWWEDIADALPDLAGREQALVDAWYLDGFAPALNEQMWHRDVLTAVAALSRDGATFATFTAAGQVRRDLIAAGFTVHKAPGFGPKRECLRGSLAQRPPLPEPSLTPWDLSAATPTKPDSVLVVGGGLAGCTTAAALARRGIAVTLLERNQLAGEGSGNEQGILYTRLSRRHSSLVDFAVASFCFAARYYRHMLSSGQLVAGQDGSLCGAFQQSEDVAEMDRLAPALEAVPELGQVLEASRASGLLGIDQPYGGYWFPGSGWLRPISVCRNLVATEGVQCVERCGDIQLRREGGEWQALAGERLVASATCAVVATGCSAAAQPGLDWLPLRAIRGQTTTLPSSPVLRHLRAALCHEGYVAPARQGSHCIGATFDLDDDDGTVRGEDHARNINALAAAVPAWRDELEGIDPGQLTGRVGYRCASPDYLPLVGPVPDLAVFLQDYAPLRNNARQILPTRGPSLSGLYLNTAHGSRGLSSTPLAAEWLASAICGEAPPLSRELGRALSPARFIVRDLGRGKL